jgi:protein-disulfide isomerase
MRPPRVPADDDLLPSLVLPLSDRDHHLNSPEAKFALVEYGDYESPSCAEGYHVVKELLHDLGEDLCYVFRNFPQSDIHPNAQAAAEAAESADMQGKFWLMHDRLFERQGRLGPAGYRELAREIGLEVDHFERDLESGAPRNRVDSDRSQGVEVGVLETPAFFVNGSLHVGSYEFQPLFDALQRPRRSRE